MRQAYHAESALAAEALLTALARELDKTHPSAAASLREGMDETLTVLRLNVPPTLARTLRSTNAHRHARSAAPSATTRMRPLPPMATATKRPSSAS